MRRPCERDTERSGRSPTPAITKSGRHRGGGTPDKPDVALGPPTDPHRFDAFMNIRVADIQAVYEAWSGKGVEFITPPIDNGGYEMRCYVRDPDGRIIESGSTREC